MEEQTSARANFHVYRGNVSPLRGEKLIFWQKQYLAAIRAGLPVIIIIIVIIIYYNYSTFTFNPSLLPLNARLTKT